MGVGVFMVFVCLERQTNGRDIPLQFIFGVRIEFTFSASRVKSGVFRLASFRRDV
jgi:hypothetical protein